MPPGTCIDSQLNHTWHSGARGCLILGGRDYRCTIPVRCSVCKSLFVQLRPLSELMSLWVLKFRSIWYNVVSTLKHQITHWFDILCRKYSNPRFWGPNHLRDDDYTQGIQDTQQALLVVASQAVSRAWNQTCGEQNVQTRWWRETLHFSSSTCLFAEIGHIQLP